MKKLIIFIFFCLFAFSGQAPAEPLAIFSIQNPGFSANDKFYIDIYGVSDEDSFELGDTDLRIQFNNLVLSNPVLSEQNSDFHSNSYYDAMSVGVTGGIYVQFQITASGSTGTVLPDTEVRLARITFDINPATYDTETSGIEPKGFGTSTVLIAGGDVVFFQFTGDYDGSLDCLPSIDGDPVTSIVVGNSYSFTPTSSGGCDPVTFEIQNKPAWASFSPATGALTGTATPAGTYSNVIITVVDSDGDEEDLAAFDIQVTSSCQAPTISGTPDNFIKVGSSYSFTPTVSNGCTPLVYSVNNPDGLNGWASLDTSTGVLSGTPVTGDVGEYTGIVITVTDDNGAGDSDSLTAFDIEVCAATTISGTPATSVVAGQAYSFTPTYSGCGDPTFSILHLPSWASFNTNTGALTGTPAAGNVGTDSDIVISVEDETGDAATLAEFDIEVTATSSSGGGSSGGGGCFLTTVQP